MASEFHFGYILLAAAAACATEDHTPKDVIDLPAKSAKYDGKQQHLEYKRPDAPDAESLKEHADNMNDNKYYNQAPSGVVYNSKGQSNSVPGDTPIHAKEYKWGWSTSSSSSDTVKPSDPSTQ